MTYTPPVLAVDPAPRDARLTLAMAEGLILPDGPVTVLRPRAGERFDPLDMSRLQLVQGFRPDHDALLAAGYDVAVAARPAPSVLVCLPRSKAEAFALIAQAAGASGTELVLVDGQKTDGIDSVFKTLRGRVAVSGVVSKAHGKLFWFDPRGVDLSDLSFRPATVSDPALGQFRTVAGVFSADGVDPASQMLAQALPDELPATLADLGAGWGYLSAAALARRGVKTLHLVEADATALDLARRNVTDPRVQFHWADATQVVLPARVDGVVMNPPFHNGRKAQPALGLAFIAAAARILAPRGRLWMVANRHLPYEGALAAAFTQIEVLAENGAFRVWQATAPKRADTGTAPRRRR
ncbi:class I SAM-dependent methyltransferase [Roseinatronobacter alkalisoli]|uniref:Class I SAM-dependent methyltransferase n=1 Tax=Roseinatronobacter alkalisoli TaxID=3028235 RepID=A0ABT5TBT2_9RHOB|nr:class I SAM-dependent methyltransferase [Roseinatronobacter sp. HJB301]MDD7972549.1 class I SAM-dependent methyltransferase [Roseinatronobacter sp. HJB301]